MRPQSNRFRRPFRRVTRRISGLIIAVAAVVTAAADPEPGWVDSEAAAELLAELVADGVMLGRDDWARLGLTPPGDSPRITRPVASSVGRTRLEIRWDLAATNAVPPRIGLRGDWRHENWQARFRWRRGVTYDDPVVGVFAGAMGPLRFAAGAVGFHHGFGILAAAPGRDPGVGAWRPLAPSRSGLRTSGGFATDRRYRGAAGSWRAGRFEFAGLTGVAGSPGRGGGRDVAMLRFAMKPSAGELAVLAASAGGARGASVSADVHQGPVRLAGEAAVWQVDAVSSMPDGAVSLGAVVRYGRWRLETQAAIARARASPWGRRAACLAGWDGSGWAVRLRAPAGARSTAGVAVSGSEDRPEATAADDRRRRQVVDVGAEGKMVAEMSWEIRWRWRGEGNLSWAPTAPWRPAALDRREEVHTMLARFERPLAVGRLRLGWRARVSQTGGESRRRQLCDVLWRGRWAGLGFRLGVATAWGDPLDLQAVTVPVPGLVLLRHWGGWSQETLVGCEWRTGAVLWRAAAARRERSRDVPTAGIWELWLRVAWQGL